MTTIADFLVMQLLVLLTLFAIYWVRERMAEKRAALLDASDSHAPPAQPRLRQVSAVAAASA
ncbi:hypothetical protein PGB34_13075 [Xenophilus arseniciresistens]|uniref:Uncharacterized protein n=1 Tax=Xenophilus arseniciresistens TaxID=1283306 RepID=A0AAE3NAG8_9BURK|nr:hypothetical protein [Xenophilus arseniciresistens]MDA7417296.1 hypothetical protein [Xenophilus arseniciresistens]